MTFDKERKIYFIGGKGGVGKSSTAAAFALLCAEKQCKTLLISTDPAHNIGDLFHISLGKEKKKIKENLYVFEINPEYETKKYINSVKENLRGLVKSTLLEEVYRQIDTAASTPGADEAALFDAMTEIILEEQQHFDKIIFDTAPTGHTIRLLSLPELMSVWIDGMIKKRRKINENYTHLLNDGEPIEDPIYDVLQKRKEKFSNVRTVLLDPNKTRYVFILLPERLPIVETEKAVTLLAKHNIHIDTIIVNKVLPTNADGDFLRKRQKIEKEYIKEIENKFSNQRIIKIPLFEEDIYTVEALQAFSHHLETLESIQLKQPL
ncbi:ArsA family ATPase [Alkalihalobacillus sp. LMS39]|uniref:ArsA family ATPase n=1 Tax=Alkalihalobacillus sp. LMS39 TaxID=2924032 RepID=UPI001FB3A9BC|nr:ArsA family ATPase [Alkalihalobacillus sp. LMS39]UOE92075.1 ArsA family ATPase [Alkalihalobacillus sp. LMS39]